MFFKGTTQPEAKEKPKSIATIPTEVPTNSEENYPVAEARNMEEVKQLLAKGYKYEMDLNGVKLFTKRQDRP